MLRTHKSTGASKEAYQPDMRSFNMAWSFSLCFLFLCLSLDSVRSNDDRRVDCTPEGNPDSVETDCYARGCIYDPVDIEGIPWCHHSDLFGYSLDGEPEETESGLKATLKRNANAASIYGNEFDKVIVEAQFQTDSRLRIKIYPDGVDRWEVPLSIQTEGATKPLYEVKFHQGANRFYFEVIRRSSGVVLFSSDLPGFVLSDQFLQIAGLLPSDKIYGIGETYQLSYKHDTFYKEYYGYTRDQPPIPNANLYGLHPQYTVLEDDGNAHSVLILNSNAQEWMLLPAPGVVYRTIGGILDLYFFLGPSPDDTNRQYTQAVGRYPLPPYWSLGFHLCRWGYNTLENMKAAVDRMEAADIPQDVQYGDIDIMERNVMFTLSEDRFGGLPEYIAELKSKGMRFLTILDPFVGIEEQNYKAYELGNELDVWVKNADNSYATSDIWPKKEDGSQQKCYFGDYSNNNTAEWWITLINDFKQLVDFDGLWIDMNEPIHFNELGLVYCGGNQLNFPPYPTKVNFGNGLMDRTLCPDNLQAAGLHYDVHSLYGWFMTPPTFVATGMATGKRPWMLTRSTFPGSGHFAAHWLGDNFSIWPDLLASIVGTLQFNRFGIPHVGPDLCGFIYDTTPELCARWMQVGAFFPYSRNHNNMDTIEQDPPALGEDVVVASRNALKLRYRLLPYLYHLFYKHAIEGSSVIRALWDEFPLEAETPSISSQFLVGPGLLVSPVIYEHARTVSAYFPDARWYSVSRLITDDELFEQGTRLGYIELEAPLSHINVHLRGGYIYPMQKEARNTELAKKNPWTLLVALDDNEEADGQLFMDDGDSADTIQNDLYFLTTYTFKENVLEGVVQVNGYAAMAEQVLEKFEIIGLRQESVDNVQLDGVDVDFVYNGNRLTVTPVAGATLATDFKLTIV